MTDMGRPKHYQPAGKWFWLGVMAWGIAGMLFADWLSR